MLAVGWPPSECSPEKCIISPDRWVIHGLWPNFKSGKYPQYCCSKETFDEDKLVPLKGDLLSKWPNLLKNESESSLWRHEWLKHGTCAQLDPRTSGLVNYFNATLHLFDSKPIYQWLASARIMPSLDKEYKIVDVHHAIESQIAGHKVQLECIHPDHSKGSPPHLWQVYFCLDRENLQPIDCPPSYAHKCGHQGLIYPKSANVI